MLADLVKIIGGAVVALIVKEAVDRWHLRIRERQTRWFPLLRAAQELRSRLLDLSMLYTAPRSQWDNHGWSDSSGVSHPLPTEARDFLELYLLDFGAEPIEDFNKRPADPGQRRRDNDAVQRVKQRIHELNHATSAMHKMAVYLGHAHKMRTELRQGRLLIHPATQREIVALLDNVRSELNGSSGAGFVNDLQDLLGESVWESEDVIGYYTFRERIFSAVGWEQFNELFRFFVHFHYKIDYEVKQTINALEILCVTLEDIVRPRWRGPGLRKALNEWLVSPSA